jgi:hypothetical protein
MLDPDDRYQIESYLGMELTSEDLAQVDGFDQLSRAQLDVVAKLVEKRGIILAARYVQEVVPSAEFSEVRELVFNFQTYINRRFPPERLPMEHLYAHMLGRPLTKEERSAAESLQALSQVQLEVVRQLSLKDTMYGMLYLGDIVKSAGQYAREAFADALLRSGKP